MSTYDFRLEGKQKTFAYKKPTIKKLPAFSLVRYAENMYIMYNSRSFVFYISNN
jgi:hypothetical protein